MIGRPEEGRRQFAVLERTRRRSAVDAVQDAEERLEVRVAVAAHVKDLVAVLLRPDALARDGPGGRVVYVVLRHRASTNCDDVDARTKLQATLVAK